MLKKLIISLCLWALIGPGVLAFGAGTSLQDLEERISTLEKQSGTTGKGETFRVYWKEGIRMDSADKDFKLKIGGRIMNDWAFLNGDEELKDAIGGKLKDNNEFRRARLYLAGTIYKQIEFKAQYDFAGGDADFKDVYIGLKKIPYAGSLRLGHFKEPFGLEELTSSKYITFMERSLPATFIPSRNTGFMLSNHIQDDRLTYALGIFRDADGYGDGDDGERQEGNYAFTARLTGLPLYMDKGENLIHLGAAYSRRRPVDREVRFRSRPEVHLTPRFVDVANVEADSYDLVGGECAMVFGPVSLQGEYVQVSINEDSNFKPDFSSYYAMASIFLTGEHRKYKTKNGIFSRVKPKDNFIDKDGWGPGAWEVAARYSSIDLDDDGIYKGETVEYAGGKLADVTVGVNWYLNPNTRVMWNYVMADPDLTSQDQSGLGNVDMFQMRFQVDF